MSISFSSNRGRSASCSALAVPPLLFMLLLAAGPLMQTQHVVGAIEAFSCTTSCTSHSLISSSRERCCRHGILSASEHELEPRCRVALAATSGGANAHHHESAFERDSVGGSVIPSRKKKHQGRKRKIKKRRATPKARDRKKRSSCSGPLPEEEIGYHVASEYANGPGGIFATSEARRSRMKSESSLDEMDPSHKDHKEYLKRLDRKPTLVLNADYQPLCYLPLSLWSWQDAVKAVFSGKVTVVDIYSDISVRAINLDVPLPSVIALNEYAPRVNERPAFTRRNVFLRDGYKCQYCTRCFRTNDLTLDHVIPRCLGGKLNWENAVTCCNKCNSRKGSLRVSELRSVGMKLLREPRVPNKYELAATAGKMLPRRVHPTWEPYLGLEKKPSTSLSKRVRLHDADGEMFFEQEL